MPNWRPFSALKRRGLACLFIVFAVATSAASAELSLQSHFKSLEGQWLAESADFTDMGHCMQSESQVLELDLRQVRGDVILGRYIERITVSNEAGDCQRSGRYHAEFAVTIRLVDGALVIGLRPERCLAAGTGPCDSAASDVYQGTLVQADDGSLRFDGIALWRRQSKD